MKTIILAAAILTAVVSSPALAGKSDNTLNIAWKGELATLDRYFNTLREGIIVGRLVWDSLLFKDPKTLEYKPLLAKSFRFVDQTTMEFDLRQGIMFHNGEEFDADDVVYTLNFVSNPDNKVLTQRNVNWIAGAEKLGKYKVRLQMKAPTPTALEFLAGPLLIYPNEYYSKVGPKGMASKPVGTGPYRVTNFKPGASITFERYKGYFAASPKGLPQIEKIVQRTIPDQNTQIAELLSKRIDWIWKVPVDQAKRMQGHPGITIANEQTMRVGYLSFDSSNRTGKSSPVNNPLVRKAIAHAIDRETIVKTLVGGSSVVVHSACHPDQFGCEQDVVTYEYNPEKAKELLAKAGFPAGFAIDMYAYRNRPYAEAIMGYLSKVGIKTNLVWLKYAALRDKVYAGEVEFTFMTWGSYSFHDVSAITSHFFKATKDDYARDNSLIVDLKEGDESVDAAKRQAAYSRAIKRIADNAYWLPLFTYNVNYAHSADLDFTPTPDEVPRFYRARWN